MPESDQMPSRFLPTSEAATVLALVGDQSVYSLETTWMPGCCAKTFSAAAFWYSAVGTPAIPDSIATRPLPLSCLTSHSAHSVACSSYERATVEIAPELAGSRPAHSTTGMPCWEAARTWPVMPGP